MNATKVKFPTFDAFSKTQDFDHLDAASKHEINFI